MSQPVSGMSGVGSAQQVRPQLTSVGAQAWATKKSQEQAWMLADALHGLWLSAADDSAVDAKFTRSRSAPAAATTQGKRTWLLNRQIALGRAGANERARPALRSRYLRVAGALLTCLTPHHMDRGDARGARRPYSHVVRGRGNCWRRPECSSQPAGQPTYPGQSRPPNLVVGAASSRRGSWTVRLCGSGIPGDYMPNSENPDSATEAAARVVYEFLAGFSEPWVLGIMSRLGGTADKAVATTVSQPTPDAAPDPASDAFGKPATRGGQTT
jgi:hypothetical protein